MKIGFLSSIDNPLLGFYLKGFFAAGLPVAAVLLDQKTFGAGERELFAQRTEGKLDSASSYDLAALGAAYYPVPSHNDQAYLVPPVLGD